MRIYNSELTLAGPGGLTLTLDRSKVWPDDPGQDTPQIVEMRGATATLACAIGEGELDDGRGPVELTDEQAEWLADVEEDANLWTYKKDDAAAERLRRRDGLS